MAAFFTTNNADYDATKINFSGLFIFDTGSH